MRRPPPEHQPSLQQRLEAAEAMQGPAATARMQELKALFKDGAGG
jgi:hypothetical protein